MRGGRVAAGTRDELRLADLLAVGLGQPVDGLREELGGLVGLVPVLVGVLVEAEVGGEVDHLEAALAERLDGRSGGLVRVGDEGAVGPLGDGVRIEGLELERDAVGGIDLVVTAAGVGARGDRGQLDGGMPPEDRGRDRAAEAGGADDGCTVLRHAAAPRRPAPRRFRAARPHARSRPPIPSSSRSIASRRRATSSSVRVRSGARNSSRSASDLFPSPACSPR